MDQIQQTVHGITSVIEKQIDDELTRLETLTITDLENLRGTRLEALKRHEDQKRQWLSQGHGHYAELPEEKSFFEVTKKSDRVVCHFYRDATIRSKIVDKHLKILANKHIETCFVKINAPKCPFLAEKLKIVIIPTILVIKDRICVDRIEGFTDLGGRDDFETRYLEWRLAQGKAIEYDGDLTEPPVKGKKKTTTVLKKKTIREEDSDDSDLSD